MLIINLRVSMIRYFLKKLNNKKSMILYPIPFKMYFKDLIVLYLRMDKQVQVKPIQCLERDLMIRIQVDF
jgi:RNA binding exosome subunit